MDLNLELKKIKQQFEKNEFDKNEYNKHRKVILKNWSDESKKIEQLVRSNVTNKSKEIDLYAVLQLSSGSTEAEIKLNYKKLVLKHHPDKNGGVQTEEWNKLSKAYQILSDKDSRFLYDNYGTVGDTLGGKASLNHHVGGDPWKPYIGNLEIGIWMFSFINDESMPELKHVTSAEQKERRHAIRVSNIVRYLQDKLSRFPEQSDPEFEQSLHQEAQKLFLEPNGKELLSTLGKIYMSRSLIFKAKSESSGMELVVSRNFFKAIYNLNLSLCKEAIPSTFSKLFSCIWFVADLVYVSFKIKSRFSGTKQDEISKLVWKLSRSEISSIACESCEKVLNNSEYSMSERVRLANSLSLLGKVWMNEAIKVDVQHTGWLPTFILRMLMSKNAP